MGIRIVTDSTSDIPKHLIDKYGIIVLPLTVHFGSEEYRDGVDIKSGKFYEKLAASESLPTTSQVAPSAFIDVYRAELDKGNSIISLHISCDLSGTYQSAELAKKTLDDDRIAVVDSRSATLGLGMIVLKAAELVEKEWGFREIVEKLKQYIISTRLIIAVDTLKYLKMGGRLSGTQAFIGDMLNIKPLLTIEDGKVVPLEKTRGQKKAIARVIEILKEKIDNVPNLVVGVANALAKETADELRELIKAEFPNVEFVETEVGSVIATHVGPGAFGVVFMEK